MSYKKVKVLTVVGSNVIENTIILPKILPEIVNTLLQLIPLGRVTTYGALAKVIGIHPRYVGRVLKANTSPIAIPCHRVVRSDGGLGSYTLNGRSNKDFKKALLKLEGVSILGDKIAKGYILDKII